jgi:hypothetical protein
MIDPAIILERTAGAFGTTVEALIGRRRFARLAAPRQACAWALRQIGLTLMEIGEILHRDHSTIVSSIARAEERATEDPDYARILAVLIAPPSRTMPPRTVAETVQKRRDAWMVEQSIHIALFWFGGIPEVVSA